MDRFFRIAIFAGVFLIMIPQAAPATGWMRTFGGPDGDDADWVEVTSDSGYILAGGMLARGQVWGYIVKTDPYGYLRWSRTYPSPGMIPNSSFYCIQQTADSGYIAVGYEVVWQASFDIWLVKLDPDGNTLWTRTYGGGDRDRGWFVRQTPDSGYVIAGSTESFVSGGEEDMDLWILRTDSLGDTLWARTYGGVEKDGAYCVNLTSDSNYIVVGGNDTEQRTWLLKIDEEGDTLWTRTYNVGPDNSGKYVEETSDGGFIVAGRSAESPGASSLYILKTDRDGDSIWAHSYGDFGGNTGYCVHQTPDGGYIVAGCKNRMGMFDPTAEGWLLRTDSLGDTLWTRTIVYDYDGLNEFRSIQLTPDGGYIIAGQTGDYEAERAYDAWLVKTDSLGYVGVEEEAPATPVTHPDWQITSSVGSQIVLRYADRPDGFHASVFNALGRKVDECHSTQTQGTITWPVTPQSAGVYFIVVGDKEVSVQKIVLIK